MKPKLQNYRLRNYVVPALLFIIFIFHLIPIPINMNINAIEINIADSSYMVERDIEISGYYRFNILSNDRFSGKIIVSGYGLSSGSIRSLELSGSSFGDIIHYYPEEDDGECVFGHFYSNRLFNNMCITVLFENFYDKDGSLRNDYTFGSWNTANGYCIVTSVNNREEALRILQGYDNTVTLENT